MMFAGRVRLKSEPCSDQCASGMLMQGEIGISSGTSVRQASGSCDRVHNPYELPLDVVRRRRERKDNFSTNPVLSTGSTVVPSVSHHKELPTKNELAASVQPSPPPGAPPRKRNARTRHQLNSGDSDESALVTPQRQKFLSDLSFRLARNHDMVETMSSGRECGVSSQNSDMWFAGRYRFRSAPGVVRNVDIDPHLPPCGAQEASAMAPACQGFAHLSSVKTANGGPLSAGHAQEVAFNSLAKYAATVDAPSQAATEVRESTSRMAADALARLTAKIEQRLA
eukprot:TRINITY_DN9063_c0_g1_i1.p1 TRINITY_DN9063_c0_g1~~TRINITY_DN9063_c0_g1_i1.p1  ORF type:complete len:328 (-),score=22.82 TRINITY_DN9063_c0_g1_i1:91-936(-)